MELDTEEKLAKAKEMLSIQADSIVDDYMLGMFNGMEFMLSLMEEREPKYKDEKDIRTEKEEL